MPNLEKLLAQLAGSDFRGRIEAAEALASVRADDERIVPALKKALSDPENTAVTEAAMDALLAIGTPEAAGALLETLLEGDEETVDHLGYFLDVAAARDWAAGLNNSLADEVVRRYDEA